jgi:integrase
LTATKFYGIIYGTGSHAGGCTAMALTDLNIKNLELPEDKPKKLYDGGGLYLYVTRKGLKSWRYEYAFRGKRNTLTFGKYTEVSLKEAREKLIDSKRLIREGIEPSEEKKKLKKPINADINTFEVVALEWYERHKVGKSEDYAYNLLCNINKNLMPFLRKRQIAEITAPDLLEVIRKIESRGAIDTAHRTLQVCGQILRYAIATSRVTYNISADLYRALTPAVRSNFPSLQDPKRIGELLRAIDSYEGNPLYRLALKMQSCVFVRPGELRNAEWSEIDFETATWKIPGPKMKMSKAHIVPLATQVIEILKELQKYTGSGQYLFSNMLQSTNPISDVSLLKALRKMGFSENEMTVHGFRSMASTLLNEQGYNRDWIERQLAHGESNKVRAAYNYADYLPERRKMMQEWADYLDTLRSKDN